MKLNADDLNDARLCLMMSMIASRHAYKTYWEDYKQDEVDKIDEILAELYTSGRWSSNDSKDCWKRLQPVYYKELQGLMHMGSKTLVEFFDDPQGLIGLLEDHDCLIEPDYEYHFGSLNGVFIEFWMRPDFNGELCMDEMKIYPDEGDYPFAYDIFTSDTLDEYKSGMQNMISWADQSILPQDQSYFGWQPFSYDWRFENHGRWYAENGNTYYIVLTSDSDDGDADVSRIEITKTMF